MELTPVPAHVPPEMVMDYNLFDDPLFAKDLHSGMAELAASGRDLIWSPHFGGHWVVIGREAAFEDSTNFEQFTSDPHALFTELAQTRQIPINMDPPEHAPFRKVLTDAFSPRAVMGMQGNVEALARELIDAIKHQPGCDFASAIAEPLPVKIFMKVAGFPVERFAEFRQWVLTSISEGDPAKRQAIMEKFNEVTRELLAARRKQRQDDLISTLIDADFGGRQATDAELEGMCLLLFIAGLDTVTNGMALVMRHLAMDTELQADLRAHPEHLNSAIEEMLRCYAANTFPRWVAHDSAFFGAPLRRGDMVLVSLPTANLDPRGFANPTAVDMDRKTPHLVFGAGVHRCVGAQLARIEIRTLLSMWLREMPPFRLDPDKPWKYHTGFVFSVDSLPIRWD